MSGRERYVAAVADGHGELYWWHAAICDELDRIGTIRINVDGRMAAVYSVTGIAGNLRGFTVTDTEKYARELINAGVLVECAPRWDFPDLWIGVPE